MLRRAVNLNQIQASERAKYVLGPVALDSGPGGQGKLLSELCATVASICDKPYIHVDSVLWIYAANVSHLICWELELITFSNVIKLWQILDQSNYLSDHWSFIWYFNFDCVYLKDFLIFLLVFVRPQMPS